MKIRSALNSDMKGAQNVVFSVLQEYGLKPDPGGVDKDLTCIEEFYHKKKGGYFGVLETESGIIATVAICKLDTETCELRKMYLLSSQRGKGLGRYLLDFSVQKARDLGYKRMVLETSSLLKEAVSLYKKYGFKQYTPSHLNFRCNQAFELILEPYK